jgi:hypothetical protein
MGNNPPPTPVINGIPTGIIQWFVNQGIAVAISLYILVTLDRTLTTITVAYTGNAVALSQLVDTVNAHCK